MKKQENEWEWCPSIFVYTTIGQNRIQKIIRMNGKFQEQILYTQKTQQILQPWTYITGKNNQNRLCRKSEIVLQITDKQREKLTGSSSDSSSDRISLSRTPKNRWPQWVWSLINKTDLGFRVFVAAQGRSVCLKE